MKYLVLLLLISCSCVPKPNCTGVENGTLFGANVEIMMCERIPTCQDNSTDCINVKCADGKVDGKINGINYTNRPAGIGKIDICWNSSRND